jgi:UDP-N-acetylglucosamine--N-acetylmuramyl-(pentapeptide) pyrophosphoryl-undecaprenol N-acetylglucosamine transferase
LKNCIIFTGGGTAGHVFPGLAVIDALKKNFNGRIVWIGSKRGMEKEILAKSGLPFEGIVCGKLRRYPSFDNFFDFFKVVAGIFISISILLKEQPCLVFSKGGYVSVPVVIAAGILRIPVFTHESDFDPGIATRINARFAEKIITSFEETERFFKGSSRKRVCFAGNPIRQSIAAGNPGAGFRTIGCDPAKKVILVMGGSQGAKPINDAVMAIREMLPDECFIVHQTGKNNLVQTDLPRYYSSHFFGAELPDILASAYLVVGRAGSNTLWELAAAGKPSILVPLSISGSRGDQIRNARSFERAGAAIVVEEDRNLRDKLLEIILKLINNKSMIDSMKFNALALAQKDAAGSIARLITDKINSYNTGGFK